MAIECKEFEFTANTSTGTQTIASGLGFTPKGYYLIGVANTADATYEADHCVIIGMSDGTTSGCMSLLSDDNSSSSNNGKHYYNDPIVIPDGASPDTARDGLASHDSFGAESIVINWVEAPPEAWKFYGLAFGGSGLNVKVLLTTSGTSSTGNQAYTGVGFQGKFGISVMNEESGGIDSDTNHGAGAIGCFLSTSKRFLVSITSEDGRTTMDTWGYADSTVCVGCLRDGTGSIVDGGRADFVSWDSDGFTLNWTDAPVLSTRDIMFMIFGGDGDWDIGKVAKRTSVGTTVVSPSSNTIKGLMLFSNCFQDSTSVGSHARMSMGVASSTSLQGGCWSGDKDASADSETAKRSEDSNILIMATEDATSSSSTTEALASISDMGTTFTLDYSVCTTLAADIFWVTVGEAVAAAEVAEEEFNSYGNIHQSFNSNRNAIYG